MSWGQKAFTNTGTRRLIETYALRETYNTSHVGAMDTRGLDDEAEEVSLSGTAIEEERKRQAKQSERMQQEHDDDDFLIMEYLKG